MHTDNTRMVKHYQCFSFLEYLRLLLKLHYLLFFYNFNGVELFFLLSEKHTAVRAFPEQPHEFEVRCSHLLYLGYFFVLL